MTHTPGPWGNVDKTVITRGLNFLSHAHYETEEGRANARLIAAAPCLLEALEATIDALAEMYRVVADTKASARERIENDPALVAARAAIARARGETA